MSTFYDADANKARSSACTGLPPSAPNCGWFTGAPFKPGAGWACVPVKPDSASLLNVTLTSAGPPPGAEAQYQENDRAGNHCQSMPALARLSPPVYSGIGCVDVARSRPQPNPPFSRYMGVSPP
jgi:hypothetical protein